MEKDGYIIDHFFFATDAALTAAQKQFIEKDRLTVRLERTR